MKLRSSLAGGVILAGALLLGCLCSVPGPAQAEPARAQHWEYCELLNLISAESQRQTATITLTQEGKILEAKDFKELAQKLGKPKPAHGRVDVLNLLGAQGWELVSNGSEVITERGRGNMDDKVMISTRWTFKRPK